MGAFDETANNSLNETLNEKSEMFTSCIYANLMRSFFVRQLEKLTSQAKAGRRRN